MSLNESQACRTVGASPRTGLDIQAADRRFRIVRYEWSWEYDGGVEGWNRDTSPLRDAAGEVVAFDTYDEAKAYLESRQ